MKKFFLFLIIVSGFLVFSSLLASEETWKEHKSRHFIIYYKQSPEDFIKAVEESAENYYDEIADDLGFTRDKIWSWDDRGKIYIYDDAEDYVSSSRQARWSSASTRLGSKTIRTYPAASGFFDTTLPHELGHIIFREYVGFKVVIPLWLDEGVAMYQEKAKRFGANAVVREALDRGAFIPLSELSHMRLTPESQRETIELYYAEAASVVYFLIADQGKFKFSNFCRNLKQGLSLTVSLQKAYYRFKDLEELNNSWMSYLKR